MPAGLGWLTRVVSSGVVISCPFTCAQVNAKKSPAKTTKVIITPPSVVKTEVKKEEPEKKPAPTVQEAMEKVKKENDYLGCGYLTGFRDGKMWYVCSSKDGNNTPTFYSYDKGRGDDFESRNRQVASLSSPKKQVTYTDGTSERFIYSPYWLSNKFRGKELKPENNCQFVKRGESAPSYDLKCYEEIIQQGMRF